MAFSLLTVWPTLRPPFLLLAVLCSVLGVSLAVAQGQVLQGELVVLTVVAAVLAHAAVNLLNEYHDFHSGLDAITTRTPFSGGSGTLPTTPAAAKYVFGMAIACLMVVIVIGGYLVWLRGWPLLLLGLLGLVLVITYTRWLTGHPWLCLLAPGLGFGPVMVIGSVIALGGQLNAAVLSATALSLLWVSALLLFNQLPDADADARVGRRHLVISHGPATAVRWLQGLLLAPYVLLLLAVFGGSLPMPAGMVVVTLPAALWLVSRLSQQSQPPTHGMLAINVVTVLLNLLLLCASLGLSL